MTNSDRTSDTIISEYEELIKIKKFHEKKEWDPLHWTYQKVLKDLEREYVGNLDEKVDRWIAITNAQYFKYAPGVVFYFQAKMLYRDGYYEAAIAVSRSICEMICYDFLSKEPQPFGTEQNIEQTLFGPIVRYLAVPKKIPNADFKNHIVDKLVKIEDLNFIKSAYKVEEDFYFFKTEVGKESKNLKRLHDLLDTAGYTNKGIFPNSTYELIHTVYDLGSDYMHARSTPNTPESDCITCLNKIGKVLAHLYCVNDILNKHIVTGYNEFPDVCKGTSFWMDFYPTPEAANRGFYNVPSLTQFEKLVALAGDWNGEWQINPGLNESGTLHFFTDGEYVKANFKADTTGNIYDNIMIRLYGDYFHLMVHEESTDGTLRKAILKFELEIFNSTILLGKLLGEEKKVYFIKA